MTESTNQLKLPDAGLCPGCAGEHARVYRPGAPQSRAQITSPEEAAELLMPLLQGLDREHCVTLNLDVKHRVIATTTVSVGSVDHTFMGPREVFRDALLHGAGAIVIAHNHPSGDAEPSRDDERITRRLGQAGDILGVEVLDHLVIGHERWISLARRGALLNRGVSADFRDARSDALKVGNALHR
jgi:DNA repair protein RadC